MTRLKEWYYFLNDAWLCRNDVDVTVEVKELADY